MACPSLEQGGGFASGMLRFVDCQAQQIGAYGYQALALPGSTFSLILTSLLTLFVAFFGYRMLFGHVPSIQEGVLALVKIGIVLALTTSWPAYQALIYDVALKGPAELASEVTTAAALPGAGGGLSARLDGVDVAFVALAMAGVGPAPADQRAPPVFGGFDAFAFGSSRILYLIGAIGALAASRLVAGLLLAIAPLFIAFLLFDGTRGLFEGWLRVLIGSALGAAATSIALGVELALLEPWLTSLLADRAAGLAIPAAPVELVVVTMIFCLVLLVMLWATARLAMGFRMEAAIRSFSRRAESRSALEERDARRLLPHTGTTAAAHSRAGAVADAIASGQRREAAMAEATLGMSRAQATSRQIAQEKSTAASAPLGQSYRRRTTSRLSTSAGLRDKA